MNELITQDAGNTQPAWPASASFLEFYQTVFRPSARWLCSDYRLRIVDQAVKRLLAHCGGTSPALGDVTAVLIEELIVAQLADRSPGWQQDIRGSLLKIVRAWDPQLVYRDHAPVALPGTLREYFERCYVPERMMGARAQTVSEYGSAIKRLNAFVGRDLLCAEVTNAIVGAFLQSVADTRVTSQTTNNYRARLLAVWRALCEAGVAKEEPRIRKLKEPRSPPEAWSVDELRKIFASAATIRADARYGAVPVNWWWQAALLVCYETGIRRGSLLALRPADIDYDQATLFVGGEAMKNKRGQEFQLSRAAVQALSKIRRPRRQYVLRCDESVGLPAFCNRIGRDFKQILADARIRPSRRRGLNFWHKIRRSTATRIAATEGVAAASNLLGHSSEYVTGRYIDPTLLPRRDVTAILPQISVVEVA